MSKRSRDGGMLTGGSGDVNPQWLKFTVTQSGADTTTTQSQPVPVIRAREGLTPTIIEVLRVLFFTDGFAEADAVSTIVLTTKNFGTTAVSAVEPSAIAMARWFTRITTSGEIAPIYPIQIDLTDDAGHGVLVATDNVFLQCNSASTGLTNVVHCWILYRMKRVGTLEYVGIVQSQQ